jgi:4-amino-4-deoxy-L-arabinose transferase-like glycosyltransferase
LLFILLGLAVIPYLGVQNDEALFTNPLYVYNSKEFCFTAFHHQIPLMVMTYIGTLKTLIYVPILKFFGGNVWSTRLPVLLAGSLTVYFFFYLTLRSGDRLAALIAGFLLATDPVFLLTNTIDWGPVALSHFLLVTGCFFLVRFASASPNSMRDLALGFFFLGLGLWNKALFLWILAGLAAGAPLFLREIRKLWTWQRALAATLALLCGASPFIMYNVRQRNATLQTTAHFNSAAIAFSKWPPLEATLNGAGLMGYFTTETWDVPSPKNPSTVRGKIAWWIARRFGEHRYNGMIYALAASLLLVPFWWRRRAAWFSIVFMIVVWILMAFTKDAGASVHHCVLLWPFPQLFVGTALASISWKQVAAALAAVLVAMNLLVFDKYIVDLERNGAAGVYNDAMFGLSRSIPDPTSDEQRVWSMDWGILNTLALTHQGRLNLRSGDPPYFTDHPSPPEQAEIDYMLHDRDGLFVGHTAAYEVEVGVRKRVEQAISSAGLRKEMVQIVVDSNQRPVFEIFRITP